MTPAGWGYSVVVGFVLIAAVNSGANLLYMAFGALLGTAAVSMFLSGVCLRHIQIKRAFSDYIVAGEAADIEYTLRNQKRMWPCMGVELREVSEDLEEAPRVFVTYLPAGESVNVSTRFVARRRGMLKLSTVRMRCSFPFGFLERTAWQEHPQDVVVYPRIGMLSRHLALQYRESIESGMMTSAQRGGGEEFYGVREYRAGDNIRAIHWKATARNQQLMIREMASNAPPQMIVVLNLRGWQAGGSGQDAAAERAIELAVALVCYGFFENFAVGLTIAGLKGEGVPMPLMGREARAAMLQRLAVVSPEQVDAQVGMEFPNRLAGRAEWIIVTLSGVDVTRDLVPPGAAPAPAGFGAGGHRTVLAVDAPDAASWVRFLSTADTMRLLRDRG